MMPEIRNKQDAYNSYAEAMQLGNAASRNGDEAFAESYWNEAEIFWDLYFYWDEEIDY